MFLIVDNTRRKIRNEIQMKFNERNLPCIISDLDHCDLYMPAAIIIVTEKYLLEPVSYFAKIYDNSPVFLWDEKTDFFTFASEVYQETYGIKLLDSYKNMISLKDDKIYFKDRRIRLTKTEQKILYFLFYYPGYHDKEHISKFCLKDGVKDMDAVPVHICNINSKSKRIIYSRMISMTRFKGYYI